MMKLKSLNHKINSSKLKHLLVENKLTELQTFDSIYFRVKRWYLFRKRWYTKLFSISTNVQIF